MGTLLNQVKRVEETDEQALIRLVQERLTLAKLAAQLGIVHEQFDPTYRNTSLVEGIYTKLRNLRLTSR